VRDNQRGRFANAPLVVICPSPPQDQKARLGKSGFGVIVLDRLGGWRQARALSNATMIEPDPRQREALADRIGKLRERHDTPEIAQIYALSF